jgi:kumamolisin
MKRPHRTRIFASICATLILPLIIVIAFAPAANATGSVAPPTGRVGVSQGENPTTIAGATATGTTAAATQMTVSFALKARNQAQLFSEASGTTSPLFSETQFAQTFGQTPSVINELESYLRGFGISAYAYSNGLDVSATGTAAQFANALSVSFKNYRIPSPHGTQSVFGVNNDPSLPGDLGSDVLAIFGLSNYKNMSSEAKRSVLKPATNSSSAIPAGYLTPADFESHYDLTPLVNAGDLGQGQTLGIVTLASFDPNDAITFWKTYLHLPVLANRFTIDNIDGGAGAVSLDNGSDETTLDVQQSGAIAPQAKIVVYEAPNETSGIYDAFSTAASQDTAGSLSFSWVDDETDLVKEVTAGTESSGYVAAFDQLFAELVVQDQAFFNGSGDWGAFGDTYGVAGGSTNLTVNTFGDSPYVTSVGGTTLAGTQTYLTPDGTAESVRIPTERAWGWDYLWPLYQALGEPSEEAAALDPYWEWGGGGGYSVFEPRPAYQQGIDGISTFNARSFLTPSDFTLTSSLLLPSSFTFNPTPSLGGGFKSSGRVEPDLSFNADPYTGYAVYDPLYTESYGAPIQQFGGTSFTGPQLNGVAADYDSAVRGRLGFWNRFIYAAAESRNSPFTPIDSNALYGSSYYSAISPNGQSVPITGSFSDDNMYYTGQPGTLFNPATGLGYADLTALFNYAKSH